MKPLEQKYHLEREQNIGWYGYETQVDTFYDHAYTTYPGINYIVKDAVMISPPGGPSGGISPPDLSKKARKYRTLKQ